MSRTWISFPGWRRFRPVVFFAVILCVLPFPTHASAYRRSPGTLYEPSGVAVDSSKNIYVADSGKNRIVILDEKGAFLRQIGAQAPVFRSGTGDGQFNAPGDVALDGAGNIYVADSNSSRVQIFRADGTFVRQVEGQFPQGVAVDSSGNIYVSDPVNSCIQVFSAGGASLRTIGSRGRGEGELNRPVGIAVRGGKVYVADRDNARIQVFGADGGFLRQIGSPGSGKEKLKRPTDVAVDGAGNIYVADGLIQVFSADGTFQRHIGDYFKAPGGVAVDDEGKVYVTDSGSNRILIFGADGSLLKQIGEFGQ